MKLPRALSVKKYRGFTLIELMITVAIIAILASIALPAYNNYIYKARRADGMEALMKLQLAQEKYRRTHTAYTNDLAMLDGIGATSAEGHYVIALTSATATVYVATATAQGAQAGDEVACRTLSINQDGPVTTTANAYCWNR